MKTPITAEMLPKKFKNFLEKENALAKYIDAFNHHHNDPCFTKKYWSERNAIMSAFIWSHTSNGFRYWDGLHAEWGRFWLSDELTMGNVLLVKEEGVLRFGCKNFTKKDIKTFAQFLRSVYRRTRICDNEYLLEKTSETTLRVDGWECSLREINRFLKHFRLKPLETITWEADELWLP